MAAELFPTIDAPSADARAQATARQNVLTKPAGSLGRLEQLGIWLSACQGVCPPKKITDPRIVVFAGDHGVAANGVSAYPTEVSLQMAANIRAGEDAMTTEEAIAAFKVGIAVADQEVDSGADLLIAGDLGIGNTTPAAAIIGSLCGAEPVKVVGRGTGIDDAAWQRKVAAVRDAMFRAREKTSDPIAFARTTASPDLAAMAGFLAQAAVRRTPVILDGVVVTSAALIADLAAPGARDWWVAGHAGAEPAHAIALERLGLEPIVSLGLRLGEGSGAATALPLVKLSANILCDMATFSSAGVSEAH